MSAANEPHAGARPLSEVSDWEDQDLLTLDEASERLGEEVRTTRAELDAARADGDVDAAARLDTRLAALTSALDRIRATAG